MRPIPLGEQDWADEVLPEVSIICWTYNHEDFISQCIEGILQQETTFRTELLVHDDASTDRTATIVCDYASRYPKLIRAILQKENQVQRGHDFVGPLFNCARSKYIAICDGDDYWCDRTKLAEQKQILDNQSDVYLCAHNSYIQEGGLTKHEWRWNALKTSFSCLDYLQESFFHTTSIMMRNPAPLPDWLKEVMQGDYAIVLWGARSGRGNIYFIPRFMSVYRKHSGGISQSLRNRNRLESYKSYLRVLTGIREAWPIAWREPIDIRAREVECLIKLVSQANRTAKAIYVIKSFSVFWRPAFRRFLRWTTALCASH